MEIRLDKNDLQSSLSMIIGVVDKRTTHKILSNVLLFIEDEKLNLQATDLEIELSVSVSLVEVLSAGRVTVNGHKLLTICKNLSDNVELHLKLNNKQQLELFADKIYFSLATLPAEGFPHFEMESQGVSCIIKAEYFRQLINKTVFSMGVQDVRYYLNGLLFELSREYLRCVASDGHRISMATKNLSVDVDISDKIKQIVIPSKAVYELQKLFGHINEDLTVTIYDNSLQICMPQYKFLTRLIDSPYPDYNKVFAVKYKYTLTIEVSKLFQSLNRAAILSNDRHRSVLLFLENNLLLLQSSNTIHESAKDEIEAVYDGEKLKIGFNVDYLLEVLACLDSDRVHFNLNSADKSVLLKPVNDLDIDCFYMIMPCTV